MMVDIRFRYKVALSCIVVMMVFVTLSGFSYAYFTLQVSGTANYVDISNTAEVKMDFTYGDKDITLENEYPRPDSEGLQNAPYTFNLHNNNEFGVTAEIYLSVLNNSAKELNPYIKVAYKAPGATDYTKKLLDIENTKAEDLWAKSEEVIESNTTSFLLDTVTLTSDETKSGYNLLLWIDETAGEVQTCENVDGVQNCTTPADSTMGKTFAAKIVVKTIANRDAQITTPEFVESSVPSE